MQTQPPRYEQHEEQQHARLQEFQEILVGTSVQRIDAAPKVSGKIVYTRDMSLPSMLYGKVKRSPYAHARILSINFEKALKIPGVKAIVTGRDFPKLGTEETPALATEVALYAGQAVVAVAAETRVLAEQALSEIEIEYQELPALLDPVVAMSDNPPAVIRHEGVKMMRPNVAKHIHAEKGDVDQAFSKLAEFTLEDSYKTSAETHFQMEPLTFLAKPEIGGGITIWATSSGSHKTQREVARYLGISPHKIRAITNLMGGWFGSKEESHAAAICAMLTIKSGRPVKLELSREETIVATGTRHPSIITIKDGISRDGKIVARNIHAVYDGGAYGHLSNAILKNAVLAASSVYKIPNFRMDVYRVYTNRTPGTPKRAPLGFQVVFAIESHMERIASEMKMDPIKFRELNALENGDETVLGERMEGISHKKALNEVYKRLSKLQVSKNFDKISAGLDSTVWREGKGYSLCAKWGFAGPHQAEVRMNDEGEIEVWCAAVENGAGTLTSLAQIVADEFGVSLEKVRMMPLLFGSDSSVSGIAVGASASRQLVNLGRAIIMACEDLKKKIAARSKEYLRAASLSDIVIGGGRASLRSDPGKFVEFTSFFSRVPTLGQITKAGVIVEGEELVGRGTWVETLGHMDETTGQARGGRISPYYITVCQGAKVHVNVETGEIRVDKIVAAMDIGKAINPALVHGQIQGSVAMSLGSALTEELVSEDGVVSNANLADYKVLTSVDMPRIETIVLETPAGHGPLGARGAGEASSLPTPAAVRNAICDAVGATINKIPIRPADVLLALSQKEKSKGNQEQLER